MNPFKSKTTATPPSPESVSLQKAEAALLEAQRAASRAAEAIGEAEADAARARAALQVVEEAERRRPAEERKAAALARAAEIDDALKAASEWLGATLRERHVLAGEVYSANRALGSYGNLLDPDNITIRPGRADIAVSWKK